MTIDNVKDGETLTLKLTGRLDTTTAPELEAAVNREVDGIKNVVLDMEKLEYVSSAGLRVLLSIQKKMADNGTFVLKNVCDEIKEVLDITGFSSFLTIE